MLFILAATVLFGICALSLVGLGESHVRVTRLLEDLDNNRDSELDSATSQTPVLTPQIAKLDAFAEVGFTRSLLALSKVRSLDPYNFPAHERDESSSLESVLPARSKTHARAL